VSDAIHRAEVDGVRVLWADLPGPMRASLVFGSSPSDEPIRLRGVSHLIQHVVESELGDRWSSAGMGTSAPHQIFHAEGDSVEVAERMASVSRLVAALVPGELVDLRARASSDGCGLAGSGAFQIRRTRFGNIGPGGAVLPEHGMLALTAADLAQWAATRLLADNAVLVLTTPPPAGLRLELPRGVRVARREHPLRRPLPAWTVSSRSFITGLVASEFGAGCLVRALGRRQGIAGAGSWSVDAKTLEVVVIGRDDQATADALVAPVTADEVRDWQEQFAEPSSDLMWSWLLSLARHWLDSADDDGETDLRALASGATAAKIDELRVAALGSAIIGAKAPTRRPKWSGEQVPQLLGTPCQGGRSCTLAGDGNTLSAAGSRQVVLRWADVVGVVRTESGARQIYAADGSEITISGTDKHEHRQLRLLADQLTSPDVTVDREPPRRSSATAVAARRWARRWDG
jgi:hypothetical protein